MNYKDKDYIDASPPDGFDLDNCPVYQAWLAKQNEDSLKAQMSDILRENDCGNNEKATKAISGS